MENMTIRPTTLEGAAEATPVAATQGSAARFAVHLDAAAPAATANAASADVEADATGPLASSRSGAGNEAQQVALGWWKKDPSEAAERGIRDSYQLITNGSLAQAKETASRAAATYRQQMGMGPQDKDFHTRALGFAWETADNFSKVGESLARGRTGEVREMMSRNRTLASAMDNWDIISPDQANRVRGAAQGYIDKIDPQTSTPLINQHDLKGAKPWAYCGIASTMQVLQFHGGDLGPQNTTQDVSSLVDSMYVPGSGTDGALMAATLRSRGLPDAQFTTQGGLTDITSTLDKGMPVPVGVTSWNGIVSRTQAGVSNEGMEVGQSYSRSFDPNVGHWGVAVGYEGTAANPTAFYVNDPDTGTQLKITASDLIRNAEGEGNMYLVTQ